MEEDFMKAAISILLYHYSEMIFSFQSFFIYKGNNQELLP